MLTPADIEQKTFSTALRGYDLDEVDDFLDEVVGTIKELTAQLESARADAAALPAAAPVPAFEPEPEPTPPEPTPPEPAGSVVDESAIGRALVAAQAAADKLLEDAEAEAVRIVEGARSEAEEWTTEREAKQREAEAEIAVFSTRVASIRSELALLATEVADRLDTMDEVIARETVPDGFGESVVVDEPDDVDPGEDSTEETSYADVGDVDVDDDFDEAVSAVNEPDHLDEALTGVANDLQLDGGEDHADFDVAAFEESPNQAPDEEE